MFDAWIVDKNDLHSSVVDLRIFEHLLIMRKIGTEVHEKKSIWAYQVLDLTFNDACLAAAK